MESEHNQTSIWAESWRVLMLNLGPAGFYVAAMLAISTAAEFLESKAGLTIAQVVAAAALAIPAHLTVLKNLSGFDSMKGSKVLMPFVLRSVGLGALVFILGMAIPAVLLFNGYIDQSEAIVAMMALFLILGVLVFAKWGTMLPASAVDADKSFAAAGRRGKIAFGYSISRLFVAFGVMTVIQLAVTYLLTLVFPTANQDFFPASGGIYFASVLAVTLGSFVGAYQIVMTAVILSRSFQKAEATAGA
jgi:hypothetical protein